MLHRKTELIQEPCFKAVILWVGVGSTGLRWAHLWVEYKTDALSASSGGPDEWGAAEARGASLRVLWNPKDGDVTSDCKHTRRLFIGP